MLAIINGMDKVFMKNNIFVKGAREHNLKNIDVSIPRDKLVVITGLSGSGKSSLAFDTIYAEGQRRYMDSLSSYARQFLGQMEKPKLDYIEGLSPAISIDQKSVNRNPRSTVGTVTEIYDYFRLLYARVGTPHCPECGDEISYQTVDSMLDKILELDDGTKIQVLAPIVRGRKGEHIKLIEDIRKNGYVRVRVDGEIYTAEDELSIDKNKKHNIEVVVDRLVIKEGLRKRLSDSVETALKLSGGILVIDVIDSDELTFSQKFSCPKCGISIEELTPRMFSFNNPYGACPKCSGLGGMQEIDVDLIIPDKSKSLVEGAIDINGWSVKEDGYSRMFFEGLAKHYKFDLDTPINKLPKKILDIILYGSKNERIEMQYENTYSKGTYMTVFEGVINSCQRRYKETQSDTMKQYYEKYMTYNVCSECNGARLKKEVLSVTVGDKNIRELTEMTVVDVKKFFDELKLSERNMIISEQIIKEINARVTFLINVGLSYLTLSRTAGTLSGGESQRIRLATQIGSGLMGVLYILDEPSIGLHQKDNNKLLSTLRTLRDLGNTLIVVEHDEDTMIAADHIIDMGPAAGVHGGEVIAEGTVEDIVANDKSITGQYLSGRKSIAIPKKRRKPVKTEHIEIIGARENNLKNVNVKINLGLFTCVTGVSGSGKSSLINEVLYKSLASSLNRAKIKPGKHKDIKGIEKLDKVINIDQSPIGRTPRSNPATYTGVFDDIRKLFEATPEAKTRGYKSGRFSFNVRGGRCEACKGDGIIKIEMHFLPDMFVPCEVCNGKRYNRETLEVRYKGKNIFDVLDMTIEEALEFFQNTPRIKKKLQTLFDVGLGYIKVGQPSTTLSGGEAQRVKLATELSKRSTGKTIYILDEPTTGLHIADVHKLIDILQELTNGGNTVIVIEHNLDVIKTADYVIDLGPEGGDAGGQIIAAGTPEDVANNSNSSTGEYLKRYFEKK